MTIEYDTDKVHFAELYCHAKKGDELAHFKLGQIYAKSNAPGSKEKAFAHYKTAAAKRYTDAMFMMGRCYENGIGIKRNYQRAIEWYKKAATGASDDVLHQMDMTGVSAEEVVERYLSDENFAKSMDALLDAQHESLPNTKAGLVEAGMSGNAKAFYVLGNQCYQKDWQQALIWYHKAAAYGYGDAMLRLAEHYERSNDFDPAAKWWRAYAQTRIVWRNARLGW